MNIKDWMEKTVIPAYLGIDDPTKLDKFEVYRALDRLYTLEGELQTFLFHQIKNRWPHTENAFFYDITSSYLTGSRCVIAKLGYSRDHRPDCEQIVIALMITPEGYPFYWRVMPGNTQDITTIKPLIEDVTARFALKNCTMIFDRGMVSTDNIVALESEKWTYVSAMDRDEIKKADFFNTAIPESATPDNYEQIMVMQEFIPFDENAFLYYREFIIDDRRYIVTFDVARFFDEHHAQLNNITYFVQLLTDKNQSLREAKKKRCKSLLEREVAAMLKRKHLKNGYPSILNHLIMKLSINGVTHEQFNLFNCRTRLIPWIPGNT
nr:IS1634 family transposase [Desulfofarcimen acetoxidans]